MLLLIAGYSLTARLHNTVELFSPSGATDGPVERLLRRACRATCRMVSRRAPLLLFIAELGGGGGGARGQVAGRCLDK